MFDVELGLRRSRILGIVRSAGRDRSWTIAAVERVIARGITMIELPFGDDHIIDTLARLMDEHPDVHFGVGTMTTIDRVDIAVELGVRFAVTPDTNVAVLERASRSRLPVIAGALTPTEIVTAAGAGAAAIKIFPAGPLGPEYIRALRGPFPDLAFVPTGGIRLADAAVYLAAGAVGVAIGGDLTDSDRPREAAG